MALLAFALVFAGIIVSGRQIAKLPTREWLWAMAGFLLIAAGQQLLAL